MGVSTVVAVEMRLILVLLVTLASVQGGKALECPERHPFAFLNGAYCCKYNKEKEQEDPEGSSCNGSIIQLNSSCCYFDAYVKCRGPSCGNFNSTIRDTVELENSVLNIDGTEANQNEESSDPVAKRKRRGVRKKKGRKGAKKSTGRGPKKKNNGRGAKKKKRERGKKKKKKKKKK